MVEKVREKEFLTFVTGIWPALRLAREGDEKVMLGLAIATADSVGRHGMSEVPGCVTRRARICRGTVLFPKPLGPYHVVWRYKPITCQGNVNGSDLPDNFFLTTYERTD